MPLIIVLLLRSKSARTSERHSGGRGASPCFPVVFDPNLVARRDVVDAAGSELNRWRAVLFKKIIARVVMIELFGMTHLVCERITTGRKRCGDKRPDSSLSIFGEPDQKPRFSAPLRAAWLLLTELSCQSIGTISVAFAVCVHGVARPRR